MSCKFIGFTECERDLTICKYFICVPESGSDPSSACLRDEFLGIVDFALMPVSGAKQYVANYEHDVQICVAAFATAENFPAYYTVLPLNGILLEFWGKNRVIIW